MNWVRTLAYVTGMVDQELLNPAVNLFLGLALEPDPLAPFQEGFDLAQIQLLGFMHADSQSSACHLQAHLALESGSRSRLFLYWIRLFFARNAIRSYNG